MWPRSLTDELFRGSVDTGWLLSALTALFVSLPGVTGGLAAPLVAAGASAVLGAGGAAALGSATGIAIMASLFGAAGAGLTGKSIGLPITFAKRPLTDKYIPSDGLCIFHHLLFTFCFNVPLFHFPTYRL